MKRKISLSAALVLVLVGVLLTYLVSHSFIAEQYREKMDELSKDQLDYQKLTVIDSVIRENYAGVIDDVVLSEGSVSGYVAGLGDPYSYYLSPEEYEAHSVVDDEEKMFSLGLSIGFDEEQNLARIYHIHSASDAASSGLAIGDVLLSVGEATIAEDGIGAVEKALFSETEIEVAVTIRRGEEVVPYTLSYTNFKEDCVSASLILGQTALIRIHRWTSETATQLKGVIDEMIAQSADTLLFDVRDTDSRAFDVAVSCADLIVPIDVPLVRIQTAAGAVEEKTADGASVPLACAVLVDDATLGAGELFAALLRDTVSALLVGEQTVGCAGAQSEIVLNDQSAIVLTTKLYLPPVSDSFALNGVQPDLEVAQSVDFRAGVAEEDPVVLEAAYGIKPTLRPTDAPEAGE